MTSMLRLALRAFVLPAMAIAFTAASAASTAATTYVVDLPRSKLEFQFRQAGADNKGQFKKYDVTLTAPGTDPSGGKLDVTVDVGSLDTGDGERDTLLKDVDLFNVKKFPNARFVAENLTKSAAGYEANGKLTIRDVTREVKVPLTFKAAGSGAQLTGKTSLKRLDFGVGQGEWKSTEWVDDQITVMLDLHLIRK
jgi:polyisoprenoid-binding protein YceI